MATVRRELGSNSLDQPPVIIGEMTYDSVTGKISSIVERRSPPSWWIGFVLTFVMVMVLLYSITYLLVRGIGIWGVDIPVAWGFAITNFVWWIGIGHAGTFISAILLLLHQSWRTSINRFAEAMTIFAVACAGLFPLLHLGRPWFFYWLLPYPNTMGIWPNFRSPLVWDVFAVSTYLMVSLIFWYLGMVPDLATLRDRAKSRFSAIVYGTLALGWRGSMKHWHHYETAYLIMAGLATPLVVSVHTVVSFDFAVALLPGWHSTVFPPYFVAGAIYSGFAMVLVLAIPIRVFYGLKDLVTERHLQNSAKLLLVTGLMVSYTYGLELFMAWYSDNSFDMYAQLNRLMGPYAWLYWTTLFCNIACVQVLWIPAARRHPLTLFLVSLAILVGMWLERYVIIVTSLHRDFLPSSWGMYAGTAFDWSTLIGSIGMFFCMMFLFVRVFPMISMSEVKAMLPEPTSTEGAGEETLP